ncbi:MAG: aminopeptidase P family protein [Euryarchaeota archaeon TMED192]|nr:MAG: aminopeptidase P family protein [Euryarchaeota archaeon TMED192]|tara:strand:+ start:1284 stop:2528 length:1245 start_codon:yes stop_codon:yes gene_type:complete
MDFAMSGPEGEDWRVPVSELTNRRKRVSDALAEAGYESVMIEDPIELYWLTGGRQSGMLVIGASGTDVETTHLVKKSLPRAIWESGGSDSPDPVIQQPRSSDLEKGLKSVGVTKTPAMLDSTLPHSRKRFLSKCLSGLEDSKEDASKMLHRLRETKSSWEIDQIRESGRVNHEMFLAVAERCGDGMTELDVASVAEEVSRKRGFGGRIRMRRWPMDCDRAVVAAGRSGGVPSFFDSAIGGSGANPMAPLGSGHRRIENRVPVLVDIVHVHRGYISDCTRMFSSGSLPEIWIERLNDMVEIRDSVVNKLGSGGTCSEAWELGSDLAIEMGYAEHLMGMKSHQAKFLGHSVGLELDESPVLANGFDRAMHEGCIMAIEPKVVYDDGAVGTEDTWVAGKDGLECLTSGKSFPLYVEW